MGWADCGEDSKGRPIGYAFEATCDHPKCTKEIDRGLSYACGGMHGDSDGSCEGYFCSEHRTWAEDPEHTEEYCLACAKEINVAFEETRVRNAFLAGVECAESGDIAKYEDWDTAADAFMEKAEDK